MDHSDESDNPHLSRDCPHAGLCPTSSSNVSASTTKPIPYTLKYTISFRLKDE